MGKKKNKFSKTWASQSDIGKRFGLSAIAVGKILIANGLRDAQTKEAKPDAIANGWCVATPLRDGAMHYMWSIEKVSKLLTESHQPLSKAEQMGNEVVSGIKQAERMLDRGEDKMGYLMMQAIFEDIPKDIKQEVASHLKSKGYASYVDGWL